MSKFTSQIYYDPDVPLGVTLQRLDTRQFWDGTAWVPKEPKPVPMAHEADPSNGIRVLDVPAPEASFPPGRFYCTRVWTLDADGNAVTPLEFQPQSIPRPNPELKCYFGVTGYSCT